MPQYKELDLRPLGWESDPYEERFKLSTLDYLSTITWTNFAFFFRVHDAQKPQVETILKEGLERTLSQVRQYAGAIERDEDGHHSIVKRKKSTVKFVVQHLDSPEDEFPSFAQIEQAHFTTAALGNLNIISIPSMTCGDKPEAHPDRNPVMAAFKANFIRGGLIFNLQLHHYANGINGWTGFIQQLAENCYAITHGTALPSFDPRCLDRSLFGSLGFERPSTSSAPNESSQTPPISRPQARKQEMPLVSLLFHLSRSKAAHLKRAASPVDNSPISTYNALCALMWRVFCRIREPHYQQGPDFKPLFGQGVSVAKQFNSSSDASPMPPRLQGNMQFDITSATSSLPQLSLADVIREKPLSELAVYIKQLGGSVTREMLAEAMARVAHVKNKPELSIRVDAFPIMAQYVTDWRVAELCKCDFGFAGLTAFRHLFDSVPQGHAIVYAPRKGPAGNDEGFELQVSFERDLVQQLVHDAEWSKYFEFRGMDMHGEGASEGMKPRL